MLTEIKTALLGDEYRTDGGTVQGQDATRTPQLETEVDPSRPVTNLTDVEHEDHVEMDELFGILKNQRRRYVLKYLSLTEGTVKLNDLSEWIASLECEKRIQELNSQERKRVYVSLYQCHLPKMDRVSVIAYDKPRGEIQPGGQFAHVTHYLQQES